MNRLVAELAQRVKEAVQASASNIQGRNAELRCVFHGPPMNFLRLVFDSLVAQGGLEARLPNGETTQFPLLLQIDQLPPGTINPRVGESGLCDESHLLIL